MRREEGWWRVTLVSRWTQRGAALQARRWIAILDEGRERASIHGRYERLGGHRGGGPHAAVQRANDRTGRDTSGGPRAHRACVLADQGVAPQHAEDQLFTWTESAGCRWIPGPGGTRGVQ